MYINSNCNNSFLPEYEPQLLQIGIVSKEQTLYKQGRKLAHQIYKNKWGTETLIDENDYGVVVSCSGKIIGNVNLQVKQKKSHLLHSEIFFTEEHWENYLTLSDGKLGEISGLCISNTIPQFLSRPTMMGLVLGLHLLHNSLQIRYLTTILIRLKNFEA